METDPLPEQLDGGGDRAKESVKKDDEVSAILQKVPGSVKARAATAEVGRYRSHVTYGLFLCLCAG